MPGSSDDDNAAAAAGWSHDRRCSRLSLLALGATVCILLVVAHGTLGAPLLQGAWSASCTTDAVLPAHSAVALASAAFDPFRFGVRSAPRRSQPSCRVLSNDGVRYNHTAQLLRDVGLGDCPRIEPLATTSRLVADWIAYVRRIHSHERPHAGVVSNMLSFAQAWAEFGAEPGHWLDWRMFFEDDIVLSVNVSASEVAPHIARLHALAAPQGFALLGVCTYGNGLTPTFITQGRWEFRRGSGRCAHAYSMTRWRAASLWDLMQSSANETVEADYDIFADVRLDVFEQSNPVWIAGSAFVCFADASKGTGWTGIFCQDRDRFPSRLGRRLRRRSA